MALALLPVFIFLIFLIYFDSYKLVKFRNVLRTIGIGCFIAIVCYALNSRLIDFFQVNLETYSHFFAPVIEEVLKAAYIIYLIRSQKVGFMVDGAIYGFAIGAGFAFVENISYLLLLDSYNLLLWIIRGFGTGIMHGGVTAIFAIVAKAIWDHGAARKKSQMGLGLLVSIILHAVFNQFFFGPIVTTLVYLIGLPVLIVFVFDKSEGSLREWLELGFDTDATLLEMITSGNIFETKLGKYFNTMKDKFPGEKVVDMLCLLRIHTELSIRAKGMLLMREKGFDVPVPQEIKEKLAELKYLEKSIGKTGQLAMTPIMHTSSRELWQIYMLGG